MIPKEKGAINSPKPMNIALFTTQNILAHLLTSPLISKSLSNIFKQLSIIQKSKIKIKKDKKHFLVSYQYRTPHLLLYNHSKGDDKNKKLPRKIRIRQGQSKKPER